MTQSVIENTEKLQWKSRADSGWTNAAATGGGLIFMNVKVRCLGDQRFEMTARTHKILSDQPFDNDGTDSAMTPPELFLSSLGACAAYYAEEYLQVRGLPLEDLELRVSAVKGERPARIVSLEIDVIAPGLTQRHRDGLLRAVDACLLTNTLHIPPHVDVRVVGSPEAAEQEELISVGG
jgi:putative redox protein